MSTEEATTKKSKFGVIKRFMEVVGFLLFFIVIVTGTISMYWLLHWIITGRTFYHDLFVVTDFIKDNVNVL